MSVRTKTASKIISALLIGVLACVEPYNPPQIKNPDKRIAIDGFLDSKEKMATVKIFYAEALSDSDAPIPDESATVFIQDDTGMKSQLAYEGDGVYRVTSLNVDPSKNYRITVAAEGHSYASDYVEIKDSPPIDSLTYDYDDDNLYVYLFTHSVNENTKYFRWDFTETWAYRSRFQSGYEVKNNQVVHRSEDIYHCWYTQPSSYIDLQNTEKLTSNIISRHVLATIPYRSIKLSNRYSVLARQFTVTKDEYHFWDQLAGTTENLGTLFDAQPSQVTGNIRDEQSGAPTIGYFSAGSAQEMRLTIDTNEIPYVDRPASYDDCTKDDYDTIPPTQALTIPDVLKLLYPVYRGIELLGYAYAYQSCADCLLFGGTNVKPDYW